MSVRVVLAAVLIAVCAVGCTSKLETVDDAETYLRDRGIALTGKKSEGPKLGTSEAFEYQSNGLKVSIYKFAEGDEKSATEVGEGILKMGKALGASSCYSVVDGFGFVIYGAKADRAEACKKLNGS